uniref:Reverse transcriptase domain-containing protein n=1 Tax=Tanacetum cinerariifolium TaxID=118510 RepID=A0A6L2P4P1_TANCI|nr:reverse transcriptase domain-containing protein [Tanacetum cinerariifolium]
MSTHSNSSHLFSPLQDPENLIRRKNLGKPSSLFDFEEVMNNNHNQEPPPHNGPPPMDTIIAAARGTFTQKTPEECYELIKNMTAHHNHWDTSTIRDETSRNISSTSTTETVDTKCETCGGPHSFTECPAVDGYTQETAYATTGNYNSGGTGSLPSNTVPNPQKDLKAITTHSGVTLAGPLVSFPPHSKEVDQEPETITDHVLTGIDYVVDPSIPLILGRPFLRTRQTLMDVYSEELTLRVDDEAITFKFGQTSKYSYNDTESINRVDVINAACEEYVQEVLGFFKNSKCGNPTPISDPIIALSSPSRTPFEGGDFISEEIEACLTSEPIPPGIDDTDLDLEGDIRLLEELLNNDPSLSHLPLKELRAHLEKSLKRRKIYATKRSERREHKELTYKSLSETALWDAKKLRHPSLVASPFFIEIGAGPDSALQIQIFSFSK